MYSKVGSRPFGKSASQFELLEGFECFPNEIAETHKKTESERFRFFYDQSIEKPNETDKNPKIIPHISQMLCASK